MPATTRTLTVKASGGDYRTLQAAWNSLSTRTAHTEIVIDAGYNPGRLNTGAQTNDDTYWVVIRSANSANLPRHVRVSPSDKADMPQFTASAGTTPALEVGANTKRVRFVGLSVESTGTADYIYLARSDRDSKYIIFDRCLFDGRYRAGSQALVGYAMYGQNIGLIDSYIYDINNNGFESKAVMLIWGSGPFGIINNYLESSTINLLSGGTSTSLAYLPQDITIARNYFRKNPAWRTDSNAVAKNLMEIKHGERILVEDNAYADTWEDGQSMAINIQSVDGRGVSYTRHVTFRYNTIENFDDGILLAAQPNNLASLPLWYVSVHDNLFTNGGRNNPNNVSSSPRAVLILDDIAYLSFKNNDIRGRFNNEVSFEGGGKTDLIFEDNIIGTATYGFQNASSLASMAPGHSVTGNILAPATWNDQLPPGNCITWPPPNGGCAFAGVQTSRHPSTKSGNFSNDPW